MAKYLSSDPDVIRLEIGSDKLNTLLDHIMDTYSVSRTAIIIDDMSDSTEQRTSHNMVLYTCINA